nr:IS3 family transposase [Rubeoparvulum massiliense]
MEKWHYLCLLMNLFNREIIGYSVGSKKDVGLVYDSYLNSQVNLSKIKVFHTDRSNEFKNQLIDEVLEAFKIQRSLSSKAVHMTMLSLKLDKKIIKTEFVFNRMFLSLEEIKNELEDYVNWHNHQRIHGALNYMTPVEYRLAMMTE